MTKRLTEDEKLRRAMDRVVKSQHGNYQQGVCVAPVRRGDGVCGIWVSKEGRRPWSHDNVTAQHRVVVDPKSVTRS